MIQYGEDKYKSDLKEMWKLCFPSDTEAFTDFYFDKVYKNEETLLYVENGCPVASLQMIPFVIRKGDYITFAGYISGAMTHPDFQKKGYMEQLLQAAFVKMKENEYEYTFLIPQQEWLFGFYEKYGYKTLNDTESVANRLFLNASRDEINVLIHFDEVNIADLHKLYFLLLNQNQNVVLKSPSQLVNILYNFFDEGGVLFVNDLGIAFTFKDNDEIIIKELFYNTNETKEKFLFAIKQYYGLDKIIFSDRPKGMIKKLNGSVPGITDIYMSMMFD